MKEWELLYRKTDFHLLFFLLVLGTHKKANYKEREKRSKESSRKMKGPLNTHLMSYYMMFSGNTTAAHVLLCSHMEYPPPRTHKQAVFLLFVHYIIIIMNGKDVEGNTFAFCLLLFSSCSSTRISVYACMYVCVRETKWKEGKNEK